MENTKENVKVMNPADSKIPEGPIAEKWTNYKAHQKLVNPANKRRLDIIVVGTGLAGASAASSLAEMGFNVLNFCIQDSPRRAHSIAAQRRGMDTDTRPAHSVGQRYSQQKSERGSHAVQSRTHPLEDISTLIHRPRFGHGKKRRICRS